VPEIFLNRRGYPLATTTGAAKVNKIHDIKIWPEFFDAVQSGRKNFEIRKNDRDYKVGDILLLREWDKELGYTGKAELKRVTYLVQAEFGLPDDICVMSLEPPK
jgi:ASCH domain.